MILYLECRSYGIALDIPTTRDEAASTIFSLIAGFEDEPVEISISGVDLPATDYELLDAMEQLRLEDGKYPYLEFHAVEEYDYLNERIQETDIFPLNALAKRLAELDTRGMAVFEGLVCMDIQKGVETIPIGSLIDYAYSGECCHVLEDAVTDEELGRFLVENGFIPETDAIPDATLELLDYAQIGKNHREAEGSTFPGLRMS